jgi:hypothetical protein
MKEKNEDTPITDPDTSRRSIHAIAAMGQYSDPRRRT